MAAGHHGDEAGARAAVSPISEGGILPDKKLGRDGARESERKVDSAREVTKDSVGLFPVAGCGRGHVTVEEADRSRDVGTGNVGTVEKLANKRRKREGLDFGGKVKEVVCSRLR